MPSNAPANGSGLAGPEPGDRRYNHALREVLDELIQHVRQISRSRDTLPQEALLQAQERLEWLADEVWRLTLEGEEHQ
ncbi:MAG: hypothetical protein JSW71_08955 [Gemmatimonadota bacterium]|nr:MAG: hypothetical protein JSW71_08955 [Gemmatimonadota bacterium]